MRAIINSCKGERTCLKPALYDHFKISSTRNASAHPTQSTHQGYVSLIKTIDATINQFASTGKNDSKKSRKSSYGELENPLCKEHGKISFPLGRLLSKNQWLNTKYQLKFLFLFSNKKRTAWPDLFSKRNENKNYFSWYLVFSYWFLVTIWISVIVFSCSHLDTNHTVILPDWTLQKRALSSFAFQHCKEFIGTQCKEIFSDLPKDSWGLH